MVGGIWYSALFSKAWSAAAGVSDAQMKSGNIMETGLEKPQDTTYKDIARLAVDSLVVSAKVSQLTLYPVPRLLRDDGETDAETRHQVD